MNLNKCLSSSGVYVGAMLWAIVQWQPLLYEEDVVTTISLWHVGMQKTNIPLNPKIATNKTKIWQLVSSITIWYTWKAKVLEGIPKCDKKSYSNNHQNLDKYCV